MKKKTDIDDKWFWNLFRNCVCKMNSQSTDITERRAKFETVSILLFVSTLAIESHYVSTKLGHNVPV